MIVTATIRHNTLKVYVDGILYLIIPKAKFLGLESWVEKADWFMIEIYLDGVTILCEYGSRAKWEAVLKVLDENLP